MRPLVVARSCERCNRGPEEQGVMIVSDEVREDRRPESGVAGISSEADLRVRSRWAWSGERAWRWLFDVAALALTLSTLLAPIAPQLFKVVFFLLILGAFFWELRTFAVRATFWTAVTTSILLAAVVSGRAPATELLDVPFFVAIVVMVFLVNSRRSEAQQRVRELLAEERERADRLAELAALKAEFTSMVAHELGNPVTAIRRLCELLRVRQLDEEDRAQILASMVGELDALSGLIRDVELASRVDGADFDLEAVPVLVGELLETAEAYLRTFARRDRPVSVQANGVASCVVLADPERVGQVLRNLLENAIKFSPPTAPVELRAAPGVTADRIRLEVVDRGPGIDPDELGRVFERFGRGRQARERKLPGVGLGLYVSRQLVRAHGSELAVRSRVQEGSTFSFELPVTSDGGRS
jgi:signal transduction histidine kinase